MPRCQHESANSQIKLLTKLEAGDWGHTRSTTVSMQLLTICPQCLYQAVYHADRSGRPARDPANWPKWLLRRVTVLRDQSPVIEAACTDLAVPRLP